MQKTEILIIGTNKSIMETIARLIDKEEKWLTTIALSVEKALAFCQTKDFSLALICAGLSKDEENQLSLGLKQLKADLPIVKHYGGGSGLLYAEIYQAIGLQ
jgi:DNA-binding NtrC family response regulator